jgi:hypothetical protein
MNRNRGMMRGCSNLYEDAASAGGDEYEIVGEERGARMLPVCPCDFLPHSNELALDVFAVRSVITCGAIEVNKGVSELIFW